MMVGTIAPTAARWQILEIKCPWEFMLRLQHALATCILPVLEYMRITSVERPRSRLHRIHQILYLPQLRDSARSRSTSLNPAQYHQSVCFGEKLERFDGGFESIESFEAILKKLPKFMCCDINMFWTRSPLGAYVLRHNLRSLKVSFSDMKESKRLHNGLDLPSLLPICMFTTSPGRIANRWQTPRSGLNNRSLSCWIDRHANCRSS